MNPQLTDLAFPLQGRAAVPPDHRARLAAAVAAVLPWLAHTPGAGLHRLNLAHGGGGLLSGRTRLVLRVPIERVDEATRALAGASFALDGAPLVLGTPSRRDLLPHRTLYAHFVDAEADDEPAFLARMAADLLAMDVACTTVCGRRQQLVAPGGTLTGYSLLLDGLSAEEALRVLETGLGAHRTMGCGLFIPHKSAAAVGV